MLEALDQLGSGNGNDSDEDAFDPHLRVIYADDNASSHSTHEVSELMGRLGIESMNWPPYSPDLNLIENCWSFLKQRVYKNGTITYRSKEDIEAVIEREWWALQTEDDFFENLYGSLPRRVARIVSVRGDNIRTNQ